MIEEMKLMAQHQPATPTGFLTIKELAARWKTSVRNIHRKIKSGVLPVHRFGRLVRIALRDVIVVEAQSRFSA
jgi:excisionase family DNA binding protein